jgi:hypothetical protein
VSKSYILYNLNFNLEKIHVSHFICPQLYELSLGAALLSIGFAKGDRPIYDIDGIDAATATMAQKTYTRGAEGETVAW